MAARRDCFDARPLPLPLDARQQFQTEQSDLEFFVESQAILMGLKNWKVPGFSNDQKKRVLENLLESL